MNLESLRKLCLSLPGAAEQIQWGNDLLFKVGGKMFLCTGMAAVNRYSIKADTDRFHELTEMAGIEPAPYLARAKWIQVDPELCRLETQQQEELIRRSYELVFANLAKKTQKALLEENS